MTAEEIRSKIEFSLLPGETEESRLIVGTLKIACQSHVSAECFMRPELIQCIKNEIAEGILERIYDDNRKEVCEAINEFVSWHHPIPEPGDPWTGPTLTKAMQARDRLLNLSRYLKPTPEGEKSDE